MPFWTSSIKKAEIFVGHVKRGIELKNTFYKTELEKLPFKVEKI